MLKKIVTALCILGLSLSASATNNARILGLGEAYYLGDITGTVSSAWQILGYKDMAQATADLTGQGKAGPVVIIKGLGENAAVGVSLNTFDKRTKGSILSTGFYNRSLEFAGQNDPEVKAFPIYPQLNLAFRLGEHKIGLNGFFESNGFYDFKGDTTFDPATNTRIIQTTDRKTSTTDVGGCISAQLKFGSFGLYPFVRVALPILKNTISNPSMTNAAGNITKTEDILKSANTNEGSANLMYNTGACLDYTFGDWGWGIIGGWYRNEQYKFSKTHTVTGSAPTTQFSPHYNSNFYDWFVAVTPNVGNDIMLGLEYQGSYQQTMTLIENSLKKDTTQILVFNDIIFNLERPVATKASWLPGLDKITPRFSLRYTIKRKTTGYLAQPDSVSSVDEQYRGSWIFGENASLGGMAPYGGLGLTFGRATIDVSTDFLGWTNKGNALTGPPLTAFTVTYDFK